MDPPAGDGQDDRPGAALADLVVLLRHLRDGGTARAAALGGSEHSARSLAAWPVEDREGPARTAKVPEETGEPGVQCLQPRDPTGDLRTSFLDHAGQLGDGIRAVSGMAPTGDPGGVLERDVKPTQLDDQTHVLDVRLAVLSIGIVASTRPWEPA